eukprot:s450_g4.t1
MLSLLPEDMKDAASRTWSEVMNGFEEQGNVELLLSRLMRTQDMLGFEFDAPSWRANRSRINEPEDPPARATVVQVVKGVSVLVANLAWWKNPSDGGVYVGDGTTFCPRSIFWADHKLKVPHQVGRRILCGRPLYVGNESELWNAEELVDTLGLQDCGNVEPPKTQSAGLEELKVLAGDALSVCSLGLVLKYVLLARPSQLGSFARVLPAAALKTLQGESAGVLPMKLPETSERELEIISMLRGLKEGRALEETKRQLVRDHLADIGRASWLWLLILMLNWEQRGVRKEEMWTPAYPDTWSPAQEAVAQRLFRCVAHFCAGDRRVQVEPWSTTSLRRGPGHFGHPLHRAYPLSWDAIQETLWGVAGDASAKRPRLSKCFKNPEELTRAAAEHLEPEAADEDVALCGAYGIHRAWSCNGAGPEQRLLSLVFDVDLVNLLYKEYEGQAEMVQRCCSCAGRLVAHPAGLKIAFPEIHGGGVDIYLLDGPWRQDFILNKPVPAEAFGLKGEPRRPRLKIMPRGWYNGMILVHGKLKTAPTMKVCEGWPLVRHQLDAGSGWLQHGRNHLGNLEVWLDSGKQVTSLCLTKDSRHDEVGETLKAWFLTISDGELRFEPRVLLSVIGAVVYLLQNEGQSAATLKEIMEVTSALAHVSRLTLSGMCVMEPLVQRAVEAGGSHLSLHFGDCLWIAMLGCLAHGIPLCLSLTEPVAADTKGSSGGGSLAAQPSPYFGAVRKSLLRNEDGLTLNVDAVLVIEEFGGVGSLTEALRLLGISPMAIVYVEIDEKLRKHFKQRHPEAITFSAIEKVTKEDVLTWRRCFPKACCVIHGGGWPCQEQSRLNAGRKGADSTRGRLLDPMLEITRWLKEVSTWPGCCPWTVVELYENVMFDAEDSKIVHGKINHAPYHVKGEQFMHCRRPRQFWLRGLDVPVGTDLVMTTEAHAVEALQSTKVTCNTQLPALKFFLEEGTERVKPEAGPWPTFTRPVKKASPPSVAAGLRTASQSAQKRWKGDAYRLQVYHYEEEWLVRDAKGVRRLKAIECARMMGLNSWHFELAKVRLTEDEMGQAVGNMFSVIVAARLLCGLIPEAREVKMDLTHQLWQVWLRNETVDKSILKSYASGLPWLPPELWASSLRSQLRGSVSSGGGRVQSWMMEAPSLALATKLCLWEAHQSPSLMNLSSGNFGLALMAGSFDVSCVQWKHLVQYKVPVGTLWNTEANAAEAVIRRLVKQNGLHDSVVVLAIQTLKGAQHLCTTSGTPGFAYHRLASLALANRIQLFVTWASLPLSGVDRPPRWTDASSSHPR